MTLLWSVPESMITGISILNLFIDATFLGHQCDLKTSTARCHHGPWRRRDRHRGHGGVPDGDWGRLLHGQLNRKSGDGRVRPQLLRHQVRNAMAPWFAAVISRHLPPKVLFT